MKFSRTKDVLDALKSTLEGLTFPSGHAFEGENFFESVRLYDVENIEQAIKDLFEFGDKRLCFVIPVGDSLRHAQNGTTLQSYRDGTFTLLISDKDYVPGKPATFGDGTNHPGLLDIKDDVIEKITGESIGLSNVVVQPVDGESYRFTPGEKSRDKGREGYVMRLSISMGRMANTLNRGSTIYSRP